MTSESVTVVIPAKNEEETIGKVIEKTREELSEYFSSIEFVVSSGSNDETNAIAREKGAEVIRDGGRGLGEAMLRGLKKAVELETDYIMSIDSDLQFLPEEAHRLIEKKDEADLILGSRFLDNGVKYDMSRSHRLGNKILTIALNFGSDLEITDAQTGYRLMKREVAEELRMIGRHTYVQETIIDAHHNGFTIEEVPVSFESRESGGSKVVARISEYAFRTFPVILHRRNISAYLLAGSTLLTFNLGGLALLMALLQERMIYLILGAMLGLMSAQTLFMSMLVDSELP